MPYFLGSDQFPDTAWVPRSSGAGPPQGSMKPVSSEEQLCLVGMMAEVGLAASFERCSVATQPLKAHSCAGSFPHSSWAWGGREILSLKACISSVTYFTVQPYQHFYGQKQRFAWRKMNEQSKGWGSQKDALTMAVGCPEEFRLYLLQQEPASLIRQFNPI